MAEVVEEREVVVVVVSDEVAGDVAKDQHGEHHG
jgi:hypothetical protein